MKQRNIETSTDNPLKAGDPPETQLSWDITAIFQTEEGYTEALEKAKELAKEIESTYKGRLDTAQQIVACLSRYEELKKIMSHVGHYSFLAVAVDETHRENLARYSHFRNVGADIASRLSFIEGELIKVDEDLMEEALTESKTYRGYLKEIKRQKPHALHPEAERVLSALTTTLNAPYTIYNRTKLADLTFPNFTIDGKDYPLSFSMFENQWEFEVDTNLRRAAYQGFTTKLKEYQHTMAATYQTQVQKEKTLSSFRGFESVVEHLLFPQQVERELFDRQIDLVMEELAPHMRRYAKLLQRVHNLEEITFADLKLSLDPQYDPEVSIEESKEYLLMSLSIMGDDYLKMVKKSHEDRWIDFTTKEGKQTGAFCTAPYRVHPYILITWTNQMKDVFILAHELGHAGHFLLTDQNQNIFDSKASTYFIEAPSTLNEILLAHHLLTTNNNPRFQRWVLASMVGKTYYHNFVTHLLEAAFQREVYRIIDEGGSLQAETLNKIKREVLEKFWGDAVKINEGAELTWMRQPHYYMGLYPYTYSAGLTIATEVSKRIIRDGQPAIDDWLRVLKAGGTKTPVELAKMARVDITTDKPLKDTIRYIGKMIDEMIELTNEMELLSR